MAKFQPTRYRNTVFNTAREAKWALFFDALNVQWMYRPQGYMVGNPDAPDHPCAARWYVPSFFLPETKTWADVKYIDGVIDWQLLANAVDWGYGLPGTEDSSGTQRGLLLLGAVPNGKLWNSDYGWYRSPMAPAHPILQHHKGGEVNVACFTAFDPLHITPIDLVFDSGNGDGLGECEDFTCEWLFERNFSKTVNQDRIVMTAYSTAASMDFGDRQ